MNNLTGMRFGRLIAIEPVGRNKYQNVIWRCACDCGNQAFVTAANLNKKTRSCGCLKIDLLKERSTSHNMANTKLYKVWASIKQRCTNPQNKRFSDYGGRGIDMCHEWFEFEPFMEWAMTHGYSDGLEIDRINNDRGYYPDNCRFVDTKTNSRNKRNSHFLTFAGNTYTVSEWAEKLNIPPKAIYKRLARGWDIPSALFLPNGSRYKSMPPDKLAALLGEWEGKREKNLKQTR